MTWSDWASSSTWLPALQPAPALPGSAEVSGGGKLHPPVFRKYYTQDCDL